ncbi:oligosaccharide:H+ symporter [Gracilibacillus alcaliphilus]|nr:oligosaccharide:H+ symporter [Gracilibacillus alcaliphilus]
MILYGYLQDKLGTKKNLVWFQSIVLVFIGSFVIYVYEPLLLSQFYLGATLGAIYLGAGFLESFTEKISRKYDFEFGKARMWGSLGYAVAAIGAGSLMNINLHINFWIASGTGGLFLLLNMLFKVEVTKEKKRVFLIFQ